MQGTTVPSRRGTQAALTRRFQDGCWIGWLSTRSPKRMERSRSPNTPRSWWRSWRSCSPRSIVGASTPCDVHPVSGSPDSAVNNPGRGPWESPAVGACEGARGDALRFDWLSAGTPSRPRRERPRPARSRRDDAPTSRVGHAASGCDGAAGVTFARAASSRTARLRLTVRAFHSTCAVTFATPQYRACRRP